MYVCRWNCRLRHASSTTNGPATTTIEIHTYVCMYVFVYTCVHLYMHECIYIYIYINGIVGFGMPVQQHTAEPIPR